MAGTSSATFGESVSIFSGLMGRRRAFRASRGVWERAAAAFGRAMQRDGRAAARPRACRSLAAVTASQIAIPAQAPPQPARTAAPFDDMLAHLSHELRTPLNALIGFADLMDAETFGPVGHPRYREYLGHIRSSGAYLLQSAENTLAVAELLAESRGAPQRSVLDLADMLASADPHAPQLAGSFMVLADRRVLVRALANLVAEARSRQCTMGCVTVSAEAEAGYIRLTLAATSTSPSPRCGASMQLALARLLLQTIGAGVRETVTTDAAAETWTAVITLDRAAQPDFFGWLSSEPALHAAMA